MIHTPCPPTPRWGKATFDHIRELVHSPDAAAAGVSTVYAASLFRTPTPDPFWADIVGGFARVPPRELELYSAAADWGGAYVAAAGGAEAAAGGWPDAWADGYAFHSLVCEGRCAEHSLALIALAV